MSAPTATPPAGYAIDRAAVRSFVDMLAAPYAGADIKLGYMTGVRPVPGEKKPELTNVTRTNLPLARAAELVDRIANQAASGKEVYLSPLPWVTNDQKAPRDPATGRNATNNLHGACWWLWGDIDDGDPDRLPPTVLVESSPDRFAGFWRLTEPVPPLVAADLSARIARRVGADQSGADLTQVLRIPGTRNLSRPGLPWVRLVRDDGPEYDLEGLLAILPPPPERPRRTSAAAGVTIDPNDQEPPVPLTPEALAVWRGAAVLDKPDQPGTIDRSRSLAKLCRVLYDAGLAGRYLAAELAARDEALGWRKYTDRGDPMGHYQGIADIVIASGRSSRPVPRIVIEPPSGIHCRSGEEGCCSEQCEHEKAQLRAENDELKTLLAGRRNRKGLGAAKDGAAEVANAVALLAQRVGPPRDERGYKVNLWNVERNAGIDVKTLRSHAKKVASHAMSDDDCQRLGVAPGTSLWEVTTEVVPKLVTRDGRQQVDGTITDTFIKPNVPPQTLPTAIATVTLPTVPHPGKYCRRHPDADLVKFVTIERKTELRCAVCHDVVSTKTEVLRTRSEPVTNGAAIPSGNECTSADETVFPTDEVSPLSYTVAKPSARGDEDPDRAVREQNARMVEARKLRAVLGFKGVSLHLRDGRLVVGNEGRLTDRLAGQLSEVRREMALLLELDAARDGPPPEPPPADVPPRPHQGPAPLFPGGGR